MLLRLSQEKKLKLNGYELNINYGGIIMKKILLSIMIVMCFGLSACDEELAAKRANPDIITIGEIDGCTVKYINRGYQYESFYIAKCNSTVAITSGYETGGKSSRHVTQAVIVDESSINIQLAELQQKKAALDKLTPDEKVLLGIK